MSFYFFLHDTSKEGLKTMSVSVAGDGPTPQVVWRVHNVIKADWYKALADIPPGRHRLIVQIDGEHDRGGIYDITITDGNCPQISKFNALLLLLLLYHNIRVL
jgi:hypothetical protein